MFEIFRAGTHIDSRGVERTFTDQDVQAIATGYNPTIHEAPILEGHDESKDNSGLIDKLIYQAGQLFGVARDMPAAFAERVKTRRLPKISVRLYSPEDKANPTPGQWALRHVAFVQVPAIKGMSSPAAAAFSESGAEFIDVSFGETETVELYVAEGFETISRIFRGLRDRMIEQDTLKQADQLLPSYTINYLVSLSERIYQAVRHKESEAKPIYTEDSLMTKEELDRREAAIAKLEAEAAQRLAALEAREGIAFAEAQAASGKILPAQKAAIAAIYAVLGKVEKIEFGEVEKSGQEILQEYFAGAVPVIKYGERSSPSAGNPERSPQAMAKQIQAEIAAAAAAGEEITFLEAINRVEAA